jgi:hypothetical protein
VYVTVYLLLMAPAALAVLGPRLAHHLAPEAATRTLTALTGIAATATVWALAVLSVGGLGRTGEIQTYARTTPTALAATDPVPRDLGALAALLLAVGLARTARLLWRRRRELRSLRALHDAVPAAGDLIVLASDQPDAYALPGSPGRPGHVVVTTAMLHALPADERQVMLAHERAHLRHRHHRYLAVAQAACALNPLLARLRDQIAFQTERWADEDAAHAVGNRPLAARSLARAALAGADMARRGPRTALAYLRHRVTARVGALQAARPASRWTLAWPAAGAALMTGLALVDVTAALARFLDVLSR